VTNSLDFKPLLDCIPMSLTSRCGPGLSKKMVRPIQVAPVSFEQVLSNKLHSTLLIRPTTSKEVSTALILSKLAKPTKSLHQPSLSDASDVKSIIVALLHTSDLS
jgi:hypothetical protein